VWRSLRYFAVLRAVVAPTGYLWRRFAAPEGQVAAEWDVLRSFGWTLQVLALIVVGSALLVGLVYDALRTEVQMLAAGGGMFLLGRWLEKRHGS